MRAQQSQQCEEAQHSFTAALMLHQHAARTTSGPFGPTNQAILLIPATYLSDQHARAISKAQYACNKSRVCRTARSLQGVDERVRLATPRTQLPYFFS
jgi:hypothetical protein